jgi:hypothetical protein
MIAVNQAQSSRMNLMPQISGKEATGDYTPANTASATFYIEKRTDGKNVPAACTK